MNKTAKSTCDSDRQSKKVKTSHGSTQGTQGQKADVKGCAAGKDACSPGPERSSESSHTMQKRSQKEAKSTHSDSPSSQQHLMKTSSADDEKRYPSCQLISFCACTMALDCHTVGAFGLCHFLLKCLSRRRKKTVNKINTYYNSVCLLLFETEAKLRA